MNTFTPRDLQLIITVGTFLLGMLTFVVGVLVLVSGTMRHDLREITSQTARLAQKGLTEEISGLVGNASTLINTINEMSHTTVGIGIFLTLLGLALMGLAGWLAFQIH